MDFDGQFDYSDIIVFDYTIEIEWNVFPNPSSDIVNIYSTSKDVSTVEIYSIDG